MKKRFLAYSTLFFLGFNLIGCADEQTNYYRQIEIDGKYDILGKTPIAAEDISKVNSYHFIYDDQGTLREIEYLKSGNKAIDPNFGVARIIFDYSKGFKKLLFLDEKGEPSTDKNGIFSIHLKLDEKGYPIAKFNYDQNVLI